MEIEFLTAEEISKKTGYKISKSYQIIKKLNKKLQEEAKEKNKEILTFPVRIRKDFFMKQIGL